MWQDVTHAVRLAASSLGVGARLEAAEFSLSDAMNCLELGDPKLDTGVCAALPSVASRILDGSLPLHSLSALDVLAVADSLLSLEVSWMGGNSFAQTLAGSLYTQPFVLSTLRALLRLKPHMHMTEAHAGNLRTPETAAPAAVPPGADADAQQPDVNDVVSALPALVAGSPPHTLATVLLALATGTLKSCELSYRAVMRGDLWEDDDWYHLLSGADLAWSVSMPDVALLLDSAEAALAASLHASGTSFQAARPAELPISAESSSGAVFSPRQVFPPLPGFVSHASCVRPGTALSVVGVEVSAQPLASDKAPSGDGSVTAAPLTSVVNGLVARLRFRRAYLCGQLLLTEGYSAPSPKPLDKSGGRLFRLPEARSAFEAAQRALDVAAALLPPHTAAPTSAFPPGFFPDYRRLYLQGATPRCVPLPSPSAAYMRMRAHLHAAQLITQMPAFASHNPLALFVPSDCAAKRSSSKPLLPGMIAPAVPAAAIARIDFPLAPAASDLSAPFPALASLPRAIADLLVMSHASAPGGQGTSTVPLAVLHPAACALKLPSASGTAAAPAAKAEDGRAAASLDSPPVVPFSGALDPPLVWLLVPPADNNSTEAPAKAAEPSTFLTGTPLTDLSRPHVSLQALLRTLEAFSRLGANVVARSWLACIVLQTTTLAPPIPEAPSGFEDYQFAHTRSAVVLGSHTVLELLQRSLLEAGASLELMATDECRKLLYLMCVPVQQLLRLWCYTRLRMRRKMNVHLRDWAVVLHEAEYLDSFFQLSLDGRREAADLAALGEAPPGGLTPLSRAEHGVLASMCTLHAYTRVVPWALDIVLALLLAHLEIGHECQLFHPDELAAVYWYQDHLLVQHARQKRMIAASRLVAELVPEVAGLTLESAVKLRDGCALMLTKPLSELDARQGEGSDAHQAGEGATDATADVASSAAAERATAPAPSRARAKQGKGKKGKGGRTADLKGDDDALLEAAAAEAASGSSAAAGSSSGLLSAAGRDALRDELSALNARAATVYEMMTVLHVAPASSPAADVTSAETELCRASIRVLAAAHMAGRYRSLHQKAEAASVAAGAVSGAEADSSGYFRDAQLTFSNRFRDFAILGLPRPLSFDEYANAFSLDTFSGRIAADLLEDASGRLAAAAAYLRRGRSSAHATLKGGLESLAAVIADGRATHDAEVLTAVLLDPVAMAPPPAAAPTAAPGRKAGKAKPAAAAATARSPPAPPATAFGMHVSELPGAQQLWAHLSQRQHLLRLQVERGAGALNPADIQRLQRQQPLSSFALLHMNRAAARCDTLSRVAVAHSIFIAQTLERAKDVFGPLDEPPPLRTLGDVSGAEQTAAASSEPASAVGTKGSGKRKGKEGKTAPAPPVQHAADLLVRSEPLPLVPLAARLRFQNDDDAVFATFALP